VTIIDSGIIKREVLMKTINVCQLSQIKQRERRKAIQREVYETLCGIGVVVMVLIVLGADSWIERLL
jgi:peptidoglycan biosynthesis protein MviN/MurJ (putative lipid II flippase)